MKIETKEHNGTTYVLATRYPYYAGDPLGLIAAAIWAPQTNIRPLTFSRKLADITIDKAIEYFTEWILTTATIERVPDCYQVPAQKQ